MYSVQVVKKRITLVTSVNRGCTPAVSIVINAARKAIKQTPAITSNRNRPAAVIAFRISDNSNNQFHCSQ